MENLQTVHKKENGKYPSGVSQSDEKWDEVRATFTKLYINDNKSLKEVRDILATTLGFYATERMYKARIRKWKIAKNTRQRETLHLIRKIEKRSAGAKSSTFRVHGRTKTLADAIQFLKKQQSRTPGVRISMRLPDSPTPSVISCDTLEDEQDSARAPGPSSASDPQFKALKDLSVIVDLRGDCDSLQLNTRASEQDIQDFLDFMAEAYPIYETPKIPTNFRQMETVLTKTRDFCLSFDLATLPTSQAVKNLEATFPFTLSLHDASAQGALGQHAQALQSYNKAADYVSSIITQQSSLCLVLMYILLISQYSKGRQAVTTAMLNYIAELGALKFDKLHPLAVLIRSIQQDPSRRNEMIELGIKRAYEFLARALGPSHPYTGQVLYRLCQLLTSRGAFHEAVKWQEVLVKSGEECWHPDTYEACCAIISLADGLRAVDKLTRAQILLDDVFERTSRMENPRYRECVRVRYFKSSSLVRKAMRDFEGAMELAREGLRVAVTAFGEDDWRAVYQRDLIAEYEAANEAIASATDK